MIPKHIISCWFGRGAKRRMFRDCIATWHDILPDWKFFEINEDSLGPFMDTPYIKSVLDRGEFVKATEIGRLVGLLRHGGFYLDADIELLRPLDPLLGHEFVIGREDETTINGAVIGSEAAHPITARLIANFPLQTSGQEQAVVYGPVFLSKALSEPWMTPTILDPEYFYPRHWDHGGEPTPNSYTDHKWAGSWRA